MTSSRKGTKDVSPIPSDNLCYQLKKVLAAGITAADTSIAVTNPDYLEEIGSWEGHEPSLDFIKISGIIRKVHRKSIFLIKRLTKS